MRTTQLIAASLLLFSLPITAGQAQDFLKPLENFVEGLTQGTAPKPAPVTKPAPQAATKPQGPPPLPRPRPDFSETNEGEALLETAAPKDEEAEPTPKAAPETSDIEPVTTKPQPERPPEPERIYQTACPALLSGKVIGEMMEPIADGICGERSPLSVTALVLNGRQVALSSAIVTNCAMAGALVDWASQVDAYATAALDSGLDSINTGTTFVCRNRNGGDERFVSEHGFANAVDITGFTLADGSNIALPGNWLPASGAEGKLLRQAHGAACGLFTTVLGPEANAEHRDHLHLDLGCHGRTCTAQICE